MARARPRVTRRQRHTIYGACIANAFELLSEALILLDEGRLARGTFLVLSAFEETLKGRYSRLAPDDDWSAFWRGFRDHTTKIERAAAYLGEDAPDGLAPVLLELRERCLYVEVFHDGRVLTPRGLASPGELDPDVVRGWVVWLKGHLETFMAEWKAERST